MAFAADGVSAAILAGGTSTRMGRDKALIPIDGIPMIQRILGTLQRVVPTVVVISDRAWEYGFLGVPVHPDVIKDRGPAAGIHSALVHASTERVLVVPCDMPYLSEELLRHILRFPDPGDVCVLEAGGVRNPLCGLSHRRVLPVIEPEIQASRHTPQYLLDLLEARTVTVTPDLPFFTPHLLANINDEADLRSVTTGDRS
jgi:molybdopterin-guanine dinucleotide biosynthesis protein A